MKHSCYLLLIVLLTGGCVTAPEFVKKPAGPTLQSKGQNPREAQQLSKAKEALNAKDSTRALLLLDGIAKGKSETETYFDALILMGKILESEGRRDEAQKAYMRVLESNYRYAKRSFAIYRLAQIHKAKDDITTALKYIDLGLAQDDIVTKDKVIFQKLKYPLLIEKENYSQALETIDFVIKNSTNQTDVSEAKDVGKNLIGIRLNRNQLMKVVNDSNLSDYHGHAYTEIGKSFFYEGKTDEAEQYFQKALPLLPRGDSAIYQIQDLKKFASLYQNVDQNAVAVLVPLTGPKRPIGENILRGLQTSLNFMGADMRLIIKDTEGLPDKAAQLAERAIFDDRVMGIIGGVTSSEADNIVKVTSKFGVPFLVLTPKSGLVENYDYTFQNSLTIKTAAKKTAEMVLKDSQYNRIAILKSADDFGETYAEAFTQYLVDNGKEVVHVEAYNLEENGSLNNSIAKIFQVYSAEGREIEYKQKLNDWKKSKPSARRLNAPSVAELLPPIMDFDALFIADSAKNGALVAATLAYFDVEHVPLIGTHLWNSHELVRRAPQQVEGSMFIDSLPPEKAWPSNNCTRSLSQALNGREPNDFAVLGYDSARIFKTALRRGSSNRVQFKEQLENIGSITGCLGEITMDPTRVLNRPVFGLRVQNGVIVKTGMF